MQIIRANGCFTRAWKNRLILALRQPALRAVIGRKIASIYKTEMMTDKETTARFKDWLTTNAPEMLEIFSGEIQVGKTATGDRELREPSAKHEFSPDNLQKLAGYFTRFRKEENLNAQE